MNEKRSLMRQRTLKAGSIAFNGAAIDCTVRNLTSAGAMLDVESPLGIPRVFTLIVPSDEVRKHCQVVWIKEKRVGVVFF